MRTKQLDDLRRENEALLDRLRVEGAGPDGGVPRDSFERLRGEKEEMELGHAKRLLRLKEVSPSCPTWFRIQISHSLTPAPLPLRETDDGPPDLRQQVEGIP